MQVSETQRDSRRDRSDTVEIELKKLWGTVLLNYLSGHIS